MIDLSGQHVFVGGGGRGIGAATARMAGLAGADISVNYRADADSANSVVRDICDSGRRAVAVQADLSTNDGAERAVLEASAQFGPVTGVVVSAGIFEGCFLNEMTPEFWDRTMSANLRSTFLLVQASVRSMREAKKGGSIVIYTSTAGQRGSSEYSAYATSKAGQIMFMRSMAKELAVDNIRVNCIAPAWTLTDMSRPSIETIGEETVASQFPLGRIGLPEDVAGPTIFLLSKLASFVTGSTITVDGGMDMRG